MDFRFSRLKNRFSFSLPDIPGLSHVTLCSCPSFDFRSNHHCMFRQFQSKTTFLRASHSSMVWWTLDQIFLKFKGCCISAWNLGPPTKLVCLQFDYTITFPFLLSSWWSWCWKTRVWYMMASVTYKCVHTRLTLSSVKTTWHWMIRRYIIGSSSTGW